MLDGRQADPVRDGGRGRIRPASAALFTPLMTGVGPVEAGVVLGAALARLRGAASCRIWSCRSVRPAAGRWSRPKSTRRSRSSYRDMDASPLGFEKGATPFLDLPATVPLPLRDSRHQGGHAVDRRRRSSPARPMMRSAPTWSTWRPSPAARLPDLRHAADRPARHFRRRGRAQPCRRLDRISACHRREAGRGGRPPGSRRLADGQPAT